MYNTHWGSLTLAVSLQGSQYSLKLTLCKYTGWYIQVHRLWNQLIILSTRFCMVKLCVVGVTGDNILYRSSVVDHVFIISRSIWVWGRYHQWTLVYLHVYVCICLIMQYSVEYCSISFEPQRRPTWVTYTRELWTKTNQVLIQKHSMGGGVHMAEWVATCMLLYWTVGGTG